MEIINFFFFLFWRTLYKVWKCYYYIVSIQFNLTYNLCFCHPISDEFRSKVACENDTIQLVCNPYSRIAVYSASFGRTSYESIQCSQPQGVMEECKCYNFCYRKLDSGVPVHCWSNKMFWVFLLSCWCWCCALNSGNINNMKYSHIKGG